MEILLLQDIPGIGKKNDLLVVGDGFALNYLLPKRAALVATPVVRKRYAEFIKRRAEEREKEKSAAADLIQQIAGKTVSFARKASKTGKLYASITEKNIADAVKEQLEVTVGADAVMLDDHIKAVGSFPVSVQLGGQNVQLTVVVTAEKESK